MKVGISTDSGLELRLFSTKDKVEGLYNDEIVQWVKGEKEEDGYFYVVAFFVITENGPDFRSIGYRPIGAQKVDQKDFSLLVRLAFDLLHERELREREGEQRNATNI